MCINQYTSLQTMFLRRKRIKNVKYLQIYWISDKMFVFDIYFYSKSTYFNNVCSKVSKFHLLSTIKKGIFPYKKKSMNKINLLWICARYKCKDLYDILTEIMNSLACKAFLFICLNARCSKISRNQKIIWFTFK